MNVVLSDLHHQLKLSWGKSLGNSDEISFQPMEALISTEGQNQKVLSCYIKLRLNCVYPLLSSLTPCVLKKKERKRKKGRKEGRKKGKRKEKLGELCYWIVCRQFQGILSDEKMVPPSVWLVLNGWALPFLTNLFRNSPRGRQGWGRMSIFLCLMLMNERHSHSLSPRIPPASDQAELCLC